MEKKKANLSTIFLIIAIAIIAVMACYIYMEKKNLSEEVATLNTNATNMQSTIRELQGKINTISNDNNSTNSFEDEENNTIDLKLGQYNLNEVDYSDPTMPNNEGCGVTLKENNECYIYEGYGAGRIGVYYVKDNKVVCNTVIGRYEEGELSYVENNIIFTFEVINSNTLKLIDIENNAKDAASKDSALTADGYVIYDEYGLAKGMTYSIK